MTISRTPDTTASGPGYVASHATCTAEAALPSTSTEQLNTGVDRSIGALAPSGFQPPLCCNVRFAVGNGVVTSIVPLTAAEKPPFHVAPTVALPFTYKRSGGTPDGYKTRGDELSEGMSQGLGADKGCWGVSSHCWKVQGCTGRAELV